MEFVIKHYKMELYIWLYVHFIVNSTFGFLLRPMRKGSDFCLIQSLFNARLFALYKKINMTDRIT